MEAIEIARIVTSFSLDEEVLKKLKTESNQSRLVEDLLVKHWGYSDKKIEEVEKQIKELQKGLDELKEKKQKYEEVIQEKEEDKLKIVKENEYERELNATLIEQAKKDRELYNQIYAEFRGKKVKMKNKIKQKEERIKKFNQERKSDLK